MFKYFHSFQSWYTRVQNIKGSSKGAHLSEYFVNVLIMIKNTKIVFIILWFPNGPGIFNFDQSPKYIKIKALNT